MDILKCNGCEYKEPRQNGYCYMFENEPVKCLKYINRIERRKQNECSDFDTVSIFRRFGV